jgi:chromosome segregation ATPase
MNNETWREQCDDLLSVTNHQQARIAELESTIAAIGTVLYGVHCCIEFDEENGASRERLLAELKYVRDELAQAQAEIERLQDSKCYWEEIAEQIACDRDSLEAGIERLNLVIKKQAEFVEKKIAYHERENARLQAEVESCRWIPVEEELPEDGKIVLATDVADDNREVALLYVSDDEWKDDGSSWIWPVTHWRRIEPPKEES